MRAHETAERELRRDALLFDRPEDLVADRPPERRGLARDGVRLLVTTPEGHRHARFDQLAEHLAPGDLLVVNESATLPASLPAEAHFGAFRIHMGTRYGPRLWLAEPRKSAAEPGPLPLSPGDRIRIAGRLGARVVAPLPGQPRLLFVQLAGDVDAVLDCCGQPIRYGYLREAPGLASYQTLFARVPGSAEMPSAARPFTPRVLDALRRRGVGLAGIVLHTGLSSLEVEEDRVSEHPMQAEPFEVSAATVRAVNRTRRQGGRVVAVGTTVVRALESAWDAGAAELRPARGFSRRFLRPGREPVVVDGLVTGMHDSATSHLALLYALAGQSTIRSAYAEATRAGYLWHEFGDSHLVLTR